MSYHVYIMSIVVFLTSLNSFSETQIQIPKLTQNYLEDKISTKYFVDNLLLIDEIFTNKIESVLEIIVNSDLSRDEKEAKLSLLAISLEKHADQKKTKDGERYELIILFASLAGFLIHYDFNIHSSTVDVLAGIGNFTKVFKMGIAVTFAAAYGFISAYVGDNVFKFYRRESIDHVDFEIIKTVRNRCDKILLNKNNSLYP